MRHAIQYSTTIAHSQKNTRFKAAILDFTSHQDSRRWYFIYFSFKPWIQKFKGNAFPGLFTFCSYFPERSLLLEE